MSALTGPSAPGLIAVVIPARNEEALIGDCLASVAAAIEHARLSLGASMPEVRVRVVADACHDATSDIAVAHGAEVTAITAINVGAARRHGIQGILDSVAVPGFEVPLSKVWLANTDADSVVPANWITQQFDYATAGADVMIGTVRPRMADLTPIQRDNWLATHLPGRPNGHVHGANLGVRADAYVRAGGFPPEPEHEDNDLVAQLQRMRAHIVISDACEVITSGRWVGRTPGGYAGFLRAQAGAGNEASHARIG